MSRLINSKNHNMATITSNMVFDFIQTHNSKHVNVGASGTGTGGISFIWTAPNRTYIINIYSNEIKVEKNLPPRIIQYKESRTKEAIKLIEKTLKEIERIY